MLVLRQLIRQVIKKPTGMTIISKARFLLFMVHPFKTSFIEIKLTLFNNHSEVINGYE